MALLCVPNCANDPRVPVRATYVNLYKYKWPESDAEFVKTTGKANQGGDGVLQPRVVDSVSCRQLYLSSYPFSRKETVPERTKKCFGRIREKVAAGNRGRRRKGILGRQRCVVVVARRLKKLSCAASRAIFQRLLSCTTSVDVVDHMHTT